MLLSKFGMRQRPRGSDRIWRMSNGVKSNRHTDGLYMDVHGNTSRLVVFVEVWNCSSFTCYDRRQILQAIVESNHYCRGYRKPRARDQMPKRVVILSDGTGNAAASIWRTNVWRMFESLVLTEPLRQSHFTMTGLELLG
jgi:hypothetical protein